MTGPNDPWSNPSGRPGQGRTDRDQPRYGESYGQPYGPSEFGSPYGAPTGPPPSSPALTVAGVLQIIQSAVWVVFGLVFVAFPATVADMLREAGVSSPTGDLKSVAVTIGLIVLAVSAAMIVLAALTLRRSNGCRVASVVLQTAFGAFLLWLLSDGTRGNPGPVLLYVASCVVVAVLLLSGSARAATGAGGRGR